MKKEEFIKLVCEDLDLKIDAINVNTSFDNTPDWDSLGVMSIIALIDSTFNIILSVDEINKIGSMKGLMDLLQEKGLIE